MLGRCCARVHDVRYVALSSGTPFDFYEMHFWFVVSCVVVHLTISEHAIICRYMGDQSPAGCSRHIVEAIFYKISDRAQKQNQSIAYHIINIYDMKYEMNSWSFVILWFYAAAKLQMIWPWQG